MCGIQASRLNISMRQNLHLITIAFFFRYVLIFIVGLKGIGTATASAILAAAFPDYAPYMAEECMVSTPDVEAEDYTQAEYLKYADHYQKFAKKLEEKDEKGDWNPHKVSLY